MIVYDIFLILARNIDCGCNLCILAKISHILQTSISPTFLYFRKGFWRGVRVVFITRTGQRNEIMKECLRLGLKLICNASIGGTLWPVSLCSSQDLDLQTENDAST